MAQLPRLTLFLLAATLGCSSVHVSPPPGLAAEREDTELARKLTPLVEAFRGDVGIYVRHLPTGRAVAIRADELFPTASMIKVPILIGVFDAIERGELDYHQKLLYRDSLLYPGVDLLGSFKDSQTVEISKVMMLMMTMSDNTASLWCQLLAGTGTTINAWLQRQGFAGTRVNSRTEGRRADWEQYGWGQTTPREMAELLVMIRFEPRSTWRPTTGVEQRW